MDTLTPKLKHAVEQAGDSPIRLADPETHQTCVLVTAEVHDRLLSEAEEGRGEQAAFLRAAKKNARARLMEDA